MSDNAHVPINTLTIVLQQNKNGEVCPDPGIVRESLWLMV